MKAQMHIFKRIRDRLFYDPYQAVSKSKNVSVGNSHLDIGFRFRFDLPRDDVALHIGDRCILRNEFIFEGILGNVRVGDGVFINGGTKVISRTSIEIGNDVTIAWGCTLYDHNSHSISYLDRIRDQDQAFIDLPRGTLAANKDWSNVVSAPIRICDNAWLGFDVVVLKGVTIGEGAIIGARAVVTKDIPPWVIAAGNPAQIVKQIPQELRRS